MKLHGWAFPALASLTFSCLTKAPATQILSFDDPECAGTKSGSACLTLLFTLTSAIRESDGDRCRGYMHWGLYPGGDVGLLGPENNKGVAGGTGPEVDLTEADATWSVTIADISAGNYQALAFLSQSVSASTAVSGDPVTLPSNSFDVPENQHTQVSVVLDYTR